MNTISQTHNQNLNELFKKRKMSAFCNAIRTKQRRRVNSKLSAHSFADHFQSIMTDIDTPSLEQCASDWGGTAIVQ
jgi:hypothetical protein